MSTHARDPRFRLRNFTHASRAVFVTSVAMLLTSLLALTGSINANAAAGSLSALSIAVAADGSAPFDADDAPGNDSSASNGIVRGMDTVNYRWEYAVGVAGDITFAQTLPAGMTWLATESLASCTGTPSNISADQRTITCTLPNRPVGVGSYLVKARVGASVNGSTLSSSVAGGGITSAPVTLTTSNTPMVGLNYIRALGDGLFTYGGVDGFQFRDGFDIFVPSAGTKGWRGAETLENTFSFTVSPPTNVTDVTLIDCGAGTHNTAKQPNPSGGTANSVINSGTWTCTQPGGPGTPVTVTVSGMNSSLTSYPTKFGNNGVINNTRAYMGVGKITWFVPRSVLPNTSIDLKFTTSNFDPNSSSGVSNYGTEFAANYAASATCVIGTETVDGNCVDRSMSLAPQPLLSSASTTNQTGGPIPGGTLFAKQPFAFITNTYNAQTNVAQTNAVLCSRWDNQLATINPSSPVLPGFGSATYLIEYGTVPYANDTERRASNCGSAGDGNPNWHTSIAAAGGAANVTAVRVTMLTGSIAPAQGINMLIPMIRTAATIPAGTPVYQFTSLRTDQFGWTGQPGFNPATGSGSAGSRALASIAKTKNTITWDVPTTAPGTMRQVTINSSVTNPFMPDVLTGQQVRLTVTMPSACETFVTGSASISPEQVTAANVGADGVACTADDVSGQGIVFNLGDIPTGTAIPPVTFNTNVSLSEPAPVTRTIRSVISSASDVQVNTDRTSTALITINAPSEFTVSKQSSLSKALNDIPYTYTVAWANRLSGSVGVAKIVDVLPFNGDGRGTTGLGSLELVSATSGTAGVTIQYTTMTSASLQGAIASDASGDTGVTWVSTMPTSGVTGVRIITPVLGSGAVGSATLTVKASGLTPTAQIANNLSAKAASLATPIVGGGQVVISSSASSVAGNVYDDTSYSWSKESGEPGIASVNVSYTGYTFGSNGVNEHGAGDDIAVTTPVTVATDASGNYLFGSVDPGNYTFTAATPAGYSAAAVPVNPFTVAANQIYTFRNFGFIVDVPDPVLVNDASATGEGIAKIVDVLANDTVDASTVVTTVGAGSQGGTITIAPDGRTVTYTPATDFIGTETFTYTVKDKARQTSSATVTMTVVGAPEAVNDSEYVVKNVAKIISVLSNDSGSSVQVTSVGSSTHGTVEIVSGGQSVKFTPTTGFTGVTSFDYTITDSIGQTSIATVSIRVLPPLVALNDAASTGLTFPVNGVAAGIPVTIPVLSNDSGFNFAKTSNTQPAHGTVTFSSAGEATYTPDGTYVGTDSFTYTITDEGGQTATATVTVTVSTPPVLVDDSARVAKGTSKTITVLANDEGVGLEVISVQGMSDTGGVAHGTATVNPNGTVTFTPAAGFTGLATFTYTTEDDYGQQLTATVRVNVVAPPTAEPISLTVTQSSTTTQELAQFVSVPAGSTVSAQSVTQPSFGTASVFSSTHIRYVAPSDQHGMATFTYTVVDDLGQTATSTVNMKVIPAPKAVADSKVTLIDTAVTVPVLVNDTGYEVEVSEVETPTHGTVSIVNNTVLFTPTDGWVGTEVFTYTIEDALGQTSVTSVTVQVFGALVAADTSVTTIKTDAIEVPVSLPVGSSVVSAGGTPNGTFEIRGDGTLWFTPNGSFVGSFTVPYTIEDAAGQVATANIRVTVNDVQSADTSSSEGAKARGSLPVTGTSSVFAVVFVSAAFTAIVSGVAMLRRKRD